MRMVMNQAWQYIDSFIYKFWKFIMLMLFTTDLAILTGTFSNWISFECVGMTFILPHTKAKGHLNISLTRLPFHLWPATMSLVLLIQLMCCRTVISSQHLQEESGFLIVKAYLSMLKISRIEKSIIYLGMIELLSKVAGDYC